MLCCHGESDGNPRSSGRFKRFQEMFEQIRMLVLKKSLGWSGSIFSRRVEIVKRREAFKFPSCKPMQVVVLKRQLTIPPFDCGT